MLKLTFIFDSLGSHKLYRPFQGLGVQESSRFPRIASTIVQEGRILEDKNQRKKKKKIKKTLEGE